VTLPVLFHIATVVKYPQEWRLTSVEKAHPDLSGPREEMTDRKIQLVGWDAWTE